MARNKKSEFDLSTSNDPFAQFGGKDLPKVTQGKREGRANLNNSNSKNIKQDENQLQQSERGAVAVADKPVSSHGNIEKQGAVSASPSPSAITQSFNKKFEQKQGIDDTHKRQTYYIHRELNEIFNMVSNTKRKGYKHFVINEALRIALIDILKDNGFSESSPEMQTLYKLAPEGE